MKIAVHSILLFIFAAIQATWMSSIEIFGVKPILFLIYVVVISCFSKRKEAAIVGFISGYIIDLLIGKIWGLYALLFMILGFSIASFYDRIIGKRNFLTIAVFVFVSTFVTEFLYYLIYFITVNNISFGHALLSVILPEAVYNFVLSVPVFLLVKKLSRFLYADKGELLG